MFQQYLSLFTTGAGVLGSLFAFLTWFRQLQRKQLESERQLAHALNNFATVSSAISDLHQGLEQLTFAVTRVELLLSARIDDTPTAIRRRG